MLVRYNNKNVLLNTWLQTTTLRIISVHCLVTISLKQRTQTGLLISFGHRMILHLWNQRTWGKDKLTQKLVHCSLHFSLIEGIDSVLSISSFHWLQTTATSITEEKRGNSIFFKYPFALFFRSVLINGKLYLWNNEIPLTPLQVKSRVDFLSLGYKVLWQLFKTCLVNLVFRNSSPATTL